ncbi:MAG: hypothetical protein R3F37_03230 [Candidatus Competibacteraceae bacterium]
MQKLWERYRDRGLVVLGVPSNDFLGQQEPGDEKAIQAFCMANFGVDFPLTAKQKVIGGSAPVISLDCRTGRRRRCAALEFSQVPDRWGWESADTWPSRVEPLADEMTAAIEGLL